MKHIEQPEIMFLRKNNDVSLLPYFQEPVYGLTTSSSQRAGWEIKKFNIENLWNKSTGKDIVVGVLDTGCDFNHLDIKKNILQGINFVDPKKDPMDDNGHGTHVTGTICAVNNGIGIVGVAPESKVRPIKVLNSQGTGSSKDIAVGIKWAADNGCQIVTMSLGSRFHNRLIANAIKYANKKGCVVFCAAGNFGIKQDIAYPAKLNTTIAIGAIDKNFNRTSFTCSGEELDFLSPGHEIVGCIPNNSYSMMSGTSMANPHAVGCAALYLSYFKSSIKDKNDYINFFKETTIHLKNTKYKNKKRYEGYGIIYPKLT